MEFFNDPHANRLMGALMPLGLEKDHGLGGLLLMEDTPNAKWRGKGTMTWSGLPKLFWVSQIEYRYRRMIGNNRISRWIEPQEYVNYMHLRLDHLAMRNH